jgi:hypothetical protein
MRMARTATLCATFQNEDDLAPHLRVSTIALERLDRKAASPMPLNQPVAACTRT